VAQAELLPDTQWDRDLTFGIDSHGVSLFELTSPTLTSCRRDAKGQATCGDAASCSRLAFRT
jgi:hypothetical protein